MTHGALSEQSTKDQVLRLDPDEHIGYLSEPVWLFLAQVWKREPR